MESTKMLISRRVFSITPSTTSPPFLYVLTKIRFHSEKRYTLVYWREMILRGFLIIFILLILLPPESLALSPFHSFRYLYEQNDVSPSPSPSHGVNFGSGGSNFQQYCYRESRSCQLKNVTACLIDSQTGTACLFVENNGENPLHLKIMILRTNKTIEEIDLTSHQMQKINISTDVDAISLNSSNGECIIHAAAQAPENHNHKHTSYSTYITPIKGGAYLIILLIIIGVILTFFKLRIRARHLDGVPYHELEMGNSKALNSEENEKEKENWDRDWDDEWGDEKPNGGNLVKVKQVNDLTTKLPNSNGRKKEWDD